MIDAVRDQFFRHNHRKHTILIVHQRRKEKKKNTRRYSKRQRHPRVSGDFEKQETGSRRSALHVRVQRVTTNAIVAPKNFMNGL